MRTTAILNLKGGVAKTVTTVNMAAILARDYKARVLLIDADCQCNCTEFFGGASDKGTLADILRLPDSYPDPVTFCANCIRGTTVDGVNLIPGDDSLMDLDLSKVELGRVSMNVLRQFVEAANGLYDYILIDCPPSLGLLTLNSLAAADSVLMPIQCEFYALEGVSQLMNTIELVRTNLNPHLEVEGVLMTMYDGRTRLAEQVVAEVRENFGELVYETMIPRTVRLSEAPSYGEPILYYDKRSKGTDTYMKLAEEVMAHGK